MALNHGAVGRERVVERSWSPRDAVLYALAVGAGQEDPARELELTTDDTEGVEQRVLPTFAVLLQVMPALLLAPGDEPLAPSETTRFLHGEQSIELHRPLPAAGRVAVTSVVREILDKGSGALVVCESVVRDADTGVPLATLVNGTFARGDGGFGGLRGASEPWERPDRPPDAEVALATSPAQALLYRLTGDDYPLHSDPAFARRAGFDRPILHGLCTFGFACRALVAEVCGGDTARFGSMSARFARPVYPGDTLRVSIWRTEAGAIFDTWAGGELVLDRGVFALAGRVAGSPGR